MGLPRAEPASEPEPERASGRPTLDRLVDRAVPVQVRIVDAMSLGGKGEQAREPHRHDYHELIWTRSGSGNHSLDGAGVSVLPRTVTLIGRGQVHVFERAEQVSGAVVRFGDELLHGGPAGHADPSWLLAGCGGRVVHVPAGEVAALESTIAALAAETARPADDTSADLQRHLLSVLLLWVQRWYDAQRTERRESNDAPVQLYRRFARQLEQDFSSHHDAVHYADALGVPAAALSHALTQATGRSTKDLVTERVMIEAIRLLRYTERNVGEIAHLTGFGDPLYFSRAFKRQIGDSPSAYRNRVRGVQPDR